MEVCLPMKTSHRCVFGWLIFTVAGLGDGVGATAADGIWVTTAAIPLFASEHNATVVDNRIYVGGGFAGSDPNYTGTTNAFFVFDPTTNRWSTLPPLPKRLHHFGITTLDGKVFVTG